MPCKTSYRYHNGHQIVVDTFEAPVDFRSTDRGVSARAVCLLPAPHYKQEGTSRTYNMHREPLATSRAEAEAVDKVVALLDAIAAQAPTP